MPNIGPLEIIVILLILLVIFGPKRIPELGRSVGQGMRNFKESVTGRDRGEGDRELRSGSPASAGEPTTPRAARAEPAPGEPATAGERAHAVEQAGEKRA
jgi:sec-independent protein translocase protein TatA